MRADNKPDLPPLLPSPWDFEIPSNVQDKKRHYWIWSKEPNAGKTTKFLIPLSEKYRAAFYNQAETFQDMHL